VPDASVAINIGASFTYYYLAPDAGTYFWHCHITPPEHLQRDVGQLYVRPRQNRVANPAQPVNSRQQQDLDLRTACVSANDILCSNPLRLRSNTVARAASGNYAYNDGDGSTSTTSNIRCRFMASIRTSTSSHDLPTGSFAT